jgi:multidrug efflux pump subunit AcrA (membrane-fusion protein)
VSSKFEVAGNVQKVHVDVGDQITKGQVLAALDPEPYKLTVAEIKAELVKARDNVTKTEAEYERQKRIFEQGAGAQRRVEVAEFNYKAAKSGVNFQIARLNNAKRDLDRKPSCGRLLTGRSPIDISIRLMKWPAARNVLTLLSLPAWKSLLVYPKMPSTRSRWNKKGTLNFP